MTADKKTCRSRSLLTRHDKRVCGILLVLSRQSKVASSNTISDFSAYLNDDVLNRAVGQRAGVKQPLEVTATVSRTCGA